MISIEQVEHIARLARIELIEKEKEKFSLELSSILDYIDKLNQVDTSEVKPVSQVTGLKNITREDEAKINNLEYLKLKKESRNQIIIGAPAKKGDYFKVPKILE